MEFVSYYEYLYCNGAELFTTIAYPGKGGKYPVVIMRSPYVDFLRDAPDEDVAERFASDNARWLRAGYAVVFQHCRGRGKSSGDCIPYINERADGLHLQEFVRNLPFYNGELYLVGGSYTTSVHYLTAPFADDIKGAVLEIQDPERYNCNYRNGFYKMGLHGEWYVNMYKKDGMPEKNYTKESFGMLPLRDFSKTVFGEADPNFDEVLRHPDRNDEFWNTPLGGGGIADAVKNSGIPILFVTGFYDIFLGGIFDMWNSMKDEMKRKCALVVHPYDHDNYAAGQPVVFDDGNTREVFGDYDIAWLDHIRKGSDAPVKKGQVTYYDLFGKGFVTDDFSQPCDVLEFTLGSGAGTFVYDPAKPTAFKGGLSANFGGCAWQDSYEDDPSVVSFYTPVFSEDVSVRGKMSAVLTVSSSCEDTCFYVRVSLVKEDGVYGLRDDINSISSFVPDYVAGECAEIKFAFDEHSFVIHKGERLRVDVSSSAYPLYVPHTNKKGLFSEQTEYSVAENTVFADNSKIILPFVH